MKRIFADSFYFLALFNPRDAANSRAVSVAQELNGPIVTTDWVLTEVADALCDPLNRIACAELIDDLRHSPHVEIEPASRELFDRGWSLYCDRPDKAGR